MTSLPDFDPDAPVNIAAAVTSQAIAVAQAQAVEGDTLPFPPNNLPALKSISGSGINAANVLGYVVRTVTIQDCIAPDGTRKAPGDKGFLEAQYGRLKVQPMPKGWMFETRQVTKLFAVVSGNPILLEASAKALGYACAFATGPNSLDLGEIEV